MSRCRRVYRWLFPDEQEMARPLEPPMGSMRSWPVAAVTVPQAFIDQLGDQGVQGLYVFPDGSVLTLSGN